MLVLAHVRLFMSSSKYTADGGERGFDTSRVTVICTQLTGAERITKQHDK